MQFLLAHLNKILRTDVRYVIRNFSRLGLMYSAIIIQGFVVYLVVARTVSSDVFGTYKYFIALFELFAIFTLTGTKMGLIRSLTQGKWGTIKISFKYTLYAGAIGSFVYLIWSVITLYQGESYLPAALIIISIFGPILYASYSYQQVLVAQKKFGKLSIYRSVSIFIQSTCLIAAFFYIQDPLALFAIYFFSLFLTTSILAKKILPEHWKKETDPSFLKYSVFQSGFEITEILVSKIDAILLFNLLGPGILGAYAFIILPVENLLQLLNNVNTIALPKMAVADPQAFLKNARRKMLFFSLFAGLCVFIYALFARYLFVFLFPAYAQYAGLSVLYCVTLIFTAPTVFARQFINIKDLRREMWFFQMLTTVFALLSVVAGVITYGIVGLIVARIVSAGFNYVISFIQMGILAKRNHWPAVMESAKKISYEL